jgi:AAA domain
MTTDTINADVAIGWLRSIYQRSQLGHADSWVTLFGVDRQGHRAVAWAQLNDLDSLHGAINRMAAAGDLWFGVAPRRERLGAGQRGKVVDCVAIPALWLDVDVAGDNHKLPGLPADYEAAIALVQRCPYRPSAVVRSGYGLQCWWVLAEPIPATEAGPLLERWQQTWAKIAKGQGVHLDNVANLDRIMRLPGTLNWKGPEPVAVQARTAFERVYQASEFDDWCDPPLAVEVRERTFTAHLAGSRFNEHYDGPKVLGQLGWTRVRDDANGDSHWHAPDASNDISATCYFEDGHTTIWSETVAALTGCPTRRPMDAYGLWTYLVFHGDFRASHDWLIEHGWQDAQLSPVSAALVGADPLVPVEAHVSVSLKVTLLGTVTTTSVRWLWPGWLPRGKLVVLDGDPDAGKSTMMLDLAARLTTGRSMPDGAVAQPPGGVILLAAEDDIDDTIAPRLLAAGGDPDRVRVIEASLNAASGESPFTIPRDLPLLSRLVNDSQSVLVVIDVLNEYLDSRVDSHKDHDIRRTLHLLRNVCQETGVTALLVRHLRKEGSTKAIYRGGGSIGIVGAARAGWTVAIHPEDESLRVLATTKNNLAPRPVPQGFQLVPHPSMPVAQVQWKGPIEIGTNELLDAPSKAAQEERAEKRTKLDQAKDAISSVLTENPGMWSDELRKSIVEGLGISDRTYTTAHAAMTVSRPGAREDGIRGWRSYLKPPPPP